MDEPVGNAPRASAIPNNSHKARAEQATSAPSNEPKEELSKIVAGKVVTRKPPVWKRAARSMIADDATSVGDFMVTDILVPAIKNLLYDIITGGASRTLFGSSRGPRRESNIRGGGPVSSIRNRYAQMEEETRRPTLTREQRARHDFQEITLSFREEAVDVLEAMIEYASRYGQVSVAELYTLCGVTGSYADQKWGWSADSLSAADIRQHRGGWLLDLPEAQVLR